MDDTRRPDDLLPLTPAMFHVMLCLADGDRHGYRVIKEVAQRTAGRVVLSTGTLYGIIKRLIDEGLAQEVESGDDRRRAYRLTPFGRDVATAEASRLEALVAGARESGLLPVLGKGGA
jgi:DNA-binding PadR family transcriptional regulator